MIVDGLDTSWGDLGTGDGRVTWEGFGGGAAMRVSRR